MIRAVLLPLLTAAPALSQEAGTPAAPPPAPPAAATTGGATTGLGAPRAAPAQGIEVRDAYAVSPRPGAPTGAAYMVIVSLGGADRLLSAASPRARQVTLHDSAAREGGVMRMEEARQGFDLPAGGELALARGGRHVMLMGIDPPLEDGGLLPLTLTFERAGEVAVEVPVDQSRLLAPPGTGHEGH